MCVHVSVSNCFGFEKTETSDLKIYAGIKEKKALMCTHALTIAKIFWFACIYQYQDARPSRPGTSYAYLGNET